MFDEVRLVVIQVVIQREYGAVLTPADELVKVSSTNSLCITCTSRLICDQ